MVQVIPSSSISYSLNNSHRSKQQRKQQQHQLLLQKCRGNNNIQLRWLLAIPITVYLYVLFRFQKSNQILIQQENNNINNIKNKNNPIQQAISNFQISPKNNVNFNNINNNINSNTAKKQKLQDKLDQIFLQTGHPYQGNLWEISDYAPQWMKDYMTWHQQERTKIDPTNFDDPSSSSSSSSYKFLVMQCIKNQDDKCGGTADRLKDFLFMLREAYITKRLLFIYWTLPAKLDEFLLPPQGGFDWRVPTWMESILENPTIGRKIYKSDVLIREDIRQSNMTLMRTRIQSGTGFAEKYNPARGPDEEPFDAVYHDVWRMFFTPSQPVRAIIEKEMKQMDLMPGMYASAHLRALYGRIDEREKEEAKDWSRNAVNCATELNPGVPILFASDHSYSTVAAREYGIEKHAHVVSRQHNSQPLHLDAAENVAMRQPYEFYDTFVDLYLMGMGRCVTYNRGGFGHWALLISYNSTCTQRQKTSSLGLTERCTWTEPSSSSSSSIAAAKRSEIPFFLDPMVESNNGGGGNGSIERRITPSRKLTSMTSKLPQWMRDYFKWHNVTKSNLTKENWNTTKYLVMSCLKSDRKCGGVTDRLRPLPSVVLNAARHKRLLLIRWDRPAQLEDFFVPPAGGVDWRLPDWLLQNLQKAGNHKSMQILDMDHRLKNKANETVIWLRLQTPDGGTDYYASQPDSESTYMDVFHELFRSFFTPVPRLANTIREQMTSHGLVPGEYAAAHFRVMYGERKWRDPNETIAITVNGINCASNLLPGAPIYFAADVKFAVDVAIEYGKQHGIPVGSLEFNENPSHFDKDKNWSKRNASHYDDTFLDLFMLAESKCVAISNGGYGEFGSYLSHNSNCTKRFFKGRKMPILCKWMNGDGSKKHLPLPSIKIPDHLLVAPK